MTRDFENLHSRPRLTTQQLVSRIRDLLGASDEVDRKRVAKLVFEYAETCKRVNEKARRCLQLVREGRRRDALRLAKEPPDLQEELVRLDFEERPLWLELCERAETPVREALDVPGLLRTAQTIYSEAGRLDHLLRKHRRMALGGAPLLDRLGVLRQVREADPQPEYWNDDVRTYEEAAVDELRAEAERADVAGDLDSLRRILAKLKSNGEWMVPPSPALVRAVERIKKPHERRRAKEQYRELSDRLNEAHAAQDETRCRELLQQWETVTQETGFEADGDEAEEAEAVREWLEDEEKKRQENEAYAKACQALEQALDETRDIGELDRLEADALRFDRGLPAVLRQRVENKRDELKRARARKFGLIVIGAVGAVVVIGILVAGYFVTVPPEERFQRFVAQARGTVVDLRGDFENPPVNDADLARLRALSQAVAPEWRRRAEMETVLREADDLIQQIDQAIQGFDNELRATTEHIGTLETPAQNLFTEEKPLEELFAAARGLDSSLEGVAQRLGRLSKRAVTNDQKSRTQQQLERVNGLMASLNRELAGVITQQMERVMAEVSRLRQDIQDTVRPWTQSLVETDPTAARSEGDALRQRGAELVSQLRYLSHVPNVPASVAAELKLAVENVQADMRSLAEAVKQVGDLHAALDRIFESYRNPGQLESELTAFTRQFPAASLSRDFVEAARSAPHWKATVAWDTLARTWVQKVRLTDSKAIEQRIAAVEAHLSAFPGSPHRRQADEYLAYLRLARDALADGKLKDLSTTTTLLNSPIIANLYVIEASGNRRFYLRNKDDCRVQGSPDKPTAYQFKYIVDGAMNCKQTLLMAKEFVAGPKPAPQSEWAQAVLKRITRRDTADRTDAWQTLYMNFIREALACKDFDPILLAVILKRDLIPHAIDTTPFVAREIRTRATLLDGLELLDLAWMDPDDEDAINARPQVTTILQSIGDFGALIEKVKRRLEDLDASIVGYRPVGMIRPGTEPGWVEPSVKQATLYIVVDDGSSAGQFHKIGTVRDGKVEWPAGVLGGYPKGTPIFAPRE